jgi:cytochrome P450
MLACFDTILPDDGFLENFLLYISTYCHDASDTHCTSSVAMLLNPEVAAKVQAELDAVIGPDRFPTFSDEEQLPYLEAVIKEVHR